MNLARMDWPVVVERKPVMVKHRPVRGLVNRGFHLLRRKCGRDVRDPGRNGLGRKKVLDFVTDVTFEAKKTLSE
ncbi:MAG: hypothetical protein QOK48_3714 [Blastocatellia bacterium]|jgi:hypothetical protein|nr:hypothetical protein [Blastocatellia bacterium]